MEVVAPLGVVRVATSNVRDEDADVVEVTFGDDVDVAVVGGGFVVDGIGEFGEEWGCGLVVDGVDGVEAERVYVKFGDPAERVFEEVIADFVAVFVVEIDGGAPGCAVLLREVGCECGEVVAFRAEVVVDDVENDGEAALVAGIDEALECEGTAVSGVNGEWRDAVAAPVAAAGEGGDGHDHNSCHAGFCECIEVRDDGVEGAFGGERADVEFVKDVVAEGESTPAFVMPGEGCGDELGWSVDALGLESRCGVGQVAAVDAEEVACVVREIGEGELMVAVQLGLHGENALDGIEDAQVDRLLFGGPDAEVPCTGGELGGAMFPRIGGKGHA